MFYVMKCLSYIKINRIIIDVIILTYNIKWFIGQTFGIVQYLFNSYFNVSVMTFFT